MIVVVIMGGLSAALVVGSLWLRTLDLGELRDMGVVLGYKDEQAVIESTVVIPQEHGMKRRIPVRAKQLHDRRVHATVHTLQREHAS
jgi:hypothetical protein